jgi:RNA polymerase sigma factor (TIGR02999 family)
VRPDTAVAADAMFTLVYDELRALAAAYLTQERPDHVLQPTALVHEAYLRLAVQSQIRWANKAHFCALAAIAMRRILVNDAIARRREKRGGNLIRSSIDLALIAGEPRNMDVLSLDEQLTRLAAMDTRQSRIVELRYFGGMSMDEIAASLDISPRTAHREWTSARAWLHRELTRHDHTDA